MEYIDTILQAPSLTEKPHHIQENNQWCSSSTNHSGLLSPNGCQVGNYAISQIVYGFLLLSQGPLKCGCWVLLICANRNVPFLHWC